MSWRLRADNRLRQPDAELVLTLPPSVFHPAQLRDQETQSGQLGKICFQLHLKLAPGGGFVTVGKTQCVFGFEQRAEFFQ